jgi:hypothetical protein
MEYLWNSYGAIRDQHASNRLPTWLQSALNTPQTGERTAHIRVPLLVCRRQVAAGHCCLRAALYGTRRAL